MCKTANLIMQGILQSVEVLPTRQLPHMAANANVDFDTWQQIHFGNDVLTWMQQLTGLQASVSHGAGSNTCCMFWCKFLISHTNDHMHALLDSNCDVQVCTRSSI